MVEGDTRSVRHTPTRLSLFEGTMSPVARTTYAALHTRASVPAQARRMRAADGVSVQAQPCGPTRVSTARVRSNPTFGLPRRLEYVMCMPVLLKHWFSRKPGSAFDTRSPKSIAVTNPVESIETRVPGPSHTPSAELHGSAATIRARSASSS